MSARHHAKLGEWNPGPAAQARIAAGLERAMQAHALRKQGLTLAEIGARMGFSGHRAHQLLMRADDHFASEAVRRRK